MTSAEECRTALQKLAGRLSELSPAERDQSALTTARNFDEY